jgi:hypothetical protein
MVALMCYGIPDSVALLNALSLRVKKSAKWSAPGKECLRAFFRLVEG